MIKFFDINKQITISDNINIIKKELLSMIVRYNNYTLENKN